MRPAFLVLGIVLCIGLSEGWFARTHDRVTTALLSDDARLAIELRCHGRSDRAVQECRSVLKRLFLSGALDPDRALRAYCSEFKESQWGGGRPPPPKLCIQRYGGWQAS